MSAGSSSNMDVELIRSGSVSSVSSIGKKRRMDEDDVEIGRINDEEQILVQEMMEIILNENNKINIAVGKNIMTKVNALAALVCRKGWRLRI